jgi:hypothetical protein
MHNRCFLRGYKKFMYTTCKNVALIDMTAPDVSIGYGASSGFYRLHIPYVALKAKVLSVHHEGIWGKRSIVALNWNLSKTQSITSRPLYLPGRIQYPLNREHSWAPEPV